MSPPFPADQDPDDAPLTTPAPALTGSDLLLWSALPDLTLNIAQTADLCGVSVRQLGYWTKQGYVAASGRGARRVFGPEALRRILAIRRNMHDGLTLRQSLRALDGGASAVPTAPAPAGRALPEGTSAESVALDLLRLFERNRGTRDSASGLSAKLGRAVEDVRGSAERLAARGVLHKTQAGGEVVYASAAGGTP